MEHSIVIDNDFRFADILIAYCWKVFENYPQKLTRKFTPKINFFYLNQINKLVGYLLKLNKKAKSSLNPEETSLGLYISINNNIAI